MDDLALLGDYDFGTSAEKRSKKSFDTKKFLPGIRKAEKHLMLLQYQTYQRLIGNKSIFAPITFAPNERILEVATGGGFWMLDVATQVPKTVSLHGVDRSSRHFPKQHPSNVSFSTCPATALPFSWEDYFAFAHQRFLSLSLTLPEWKSALSELHRVVKPGGWVQVGEIYPAFPPGEFGTKQKAIFYAISQTRGLDLDIPLHLEFHLTAAGFVNVKVEESQGRCGAGHGSQGQTYKGRMLALTKVMKSEVIKAGGFGVVSSKQEYDLMVKGLEKEYDQYESEIRLFTCVAQKPFKEKP
ncbi:hypothetical protein D9611_008137 [Ephemerocybe angulata]|uniref:Methyltransferase domain-containing protein n=1 Tax=Ephemerocybe angulata TaxID=980116 RepID=A0A8H5FCX3_9AGAR|nr:hypothetical protein D9611_008137 [Tulosesus angulatus]